MLDLSEVQAEVTLSPSLSSEKAETHRADRSSARMAGVKGVRQMGQRETE